MQLHNKKGLQGWCQKTLNDKSKINKDIYLKVKYASRISKEYIDYEVEKENPQAIDDVLNNLTWDDITTEGDY